MFSKKPTFKVNINKRTSKGFRPKTISNIMLNEKKKVNTKKLNYSTTEFSVGPNVASVFIPNYEIINEILSVKSKQNVEDKTNFDFMYYLNNIESCIIDHTVFPYDFYIVPDIEKNPLDICKKKNLNPFIAFRVYYSQFGKGLKQDILSHILSKAWHSSENEQMIWNRLREEFCRKK